MFRILQLCNIYRFSDNSTHFVFQSDAFLQTITEILIWLRKDLTIKFDVPHYFSPILLFKNIKNIFYSI